MYGSFRGSISNFRIIFFHSFSFFLKIKISPMSIPQFDITQVKYHFILLKLFDYLMNLRTNMNLHIWRRITIIKVHVYQTHYTFYFRNIFFLFILKCNDKKKNVIALYKCNKLSWYGSIFIYRRYPANSCSFRWSMFWPHPGGSATSMALQPLFPGIVF